MRVKKEKNLMELYGYYQPYLIQMGKAPLHKWLTIGEMKMSRGAIQAAYKEIDKLKEKGLDVTLPEYLALISSRYVFSVLLKLNPPVSGNLKFLVPFLVSAMEQCPDDSPNLIRLVMRHPKVVFEIPEFMDYCKRLEIKPETQAKLKSSAFIAKNISDLYFSVEIGGLELSRVMKQLVQLNQYSLDPDTKLCSSLDDWYPGDDPRSASLAAKIIKKK